MSEKTWPALRLMFGEPSAPSSVLTEALLLTLDDFALRAIDESPPSPDGLRRTGAQSTWLVFFASSESRDAARAALEQTPWRAELDIERVDVPDEDWAGRTQRALTAIRVDDIIVAPPWDAGKSPGPLVVVIEPSMGFGTGHHETTRLCLRALQRLRLAERRVIDIGTGSGVLAIAAAMLGAAGVIAIDADENAVTSARDNVARNRVGDQVRVRQAALGDSSLEALDQSRSPASVVIANLTAALLRREAAAVERLVEADGTLILSGFTCAEAPVVADAYTHAALEAQLEENDWAALIFVRR
ncbi:MAG: methyltransferase [Luteitalea sp.]|nr:methyltransferase [Luteitalea sp.]